jgi:hypothetical protein
LVVLLSQKVARFEFENQLFEKIQGWQGGADMNPSSEGTTETRFAAYVAGLASVLGHADRIGPLRDTR